MTIYYVCDKTGNDENNGSKESPFKTINKSTFKVLPGDTVLVNPGIYRERILPIMSGKNYEPITFKSLEKHKAIVRGSVIWKPTEETNEFGFRICKGLLNEGDFTDRFVKDGANPFKIPLCVTPYGRNGRPEAIRGEIPIEECDPNMIYCLGQVFVNSKMYTQKPYEHEMKTTKESWFYNKVRNRLHINLGEDAGETPEIEICNQRRLFAPNFRGLRYINIDGFVFEHCGNNYPNEFWKYPGQQQAGAVGVRRGRNWTIENNIIRYANGIGIDWGNEGNSSQDSEHGPTENITSVLHSSHHIIRNNIISDNGAAGTASFMGKRFEFTGNIVERNNNLHFSGKRRWESAGLKVHRPDNSVIENNLIRNNYCHGIWSDQGAGKNCVYRRNIIMDNEKSGIDFEIGQLTTGEVEKNVFYNNNYGISFMTSGGVLVKDNLFIYSRDCDIHTRIWDRTKDKWDSLNVEIYQNIFMNSPQYLQLTPPCNDPLKQASRYLNKNVYNSVDKGSKYQVIIDSKNKTSMPLSIWKKTWADVNDLDKSDNDSVEIDGLEANLEETDDFIKIKIKVNPECLDALKVPSSVFVKNEDVADDFNCIGPFYLKNGENEFTIWNKKI